MNEARLSISAGIALEAGELGQVLGPPLSDEAARLRHGAALAAALLLHVSVPLLLLLALPLPERALAPETIPVELVLLPEPKAPPKPKVEQTAEPQPRTQVYRESGGDPELAQGRPPEAKAPAKPEVVAKTEQPQPTPATAEAPLLPALAEMPAPPLPVPRPVERRKTNETVAALPPRPQPAAPTPAAPATLTPSDSALLGKGGGDRYLNKVRESILRNLIYPGIARSQRLAGVAKYQILIDRQGRVLGMRLLHSSGAEMLDRAGWDAVELGAPFGPPPEDVPGDQIGLELTLYIGPDAQKFQ